MTPMTPMGKTGIMGLMGVMGVLGNPGVGAPCGARLSYHNLCGLDRAVGAGDTTDADTG